MRLLIYTHSFAPQFGGVETLVMTLARDLAGGQGASEPIEVVVATETPRGKMDDRSLSFPIVREPSLFELFGLLRKADVVHLAGPSLRPLLLSLLLGKRVVIEHHGYQAICPNGLLVYEPTKAACPGHFMAGRHRECLRCNSGQGWLRSLRMWALTFPRRWLARHGTANVAVSAHVAERLALPRSRVIYHGIQDCGQGGTNPARGLGSPPRGSSEICFGYVGRLVSEKGLPLLIEAAGRLRAEGRQFRLKFVGDGPERERLEQGARAAGLSDRIAITGMVTGEALERAVADIAALVMPSVWEETAGLAALEQMMRGRLVIAADIGGLGEMVGDAGLKFKPGDVDGLCACLRRTLDRPEIVREYGAKAHERAWKLFRSERMVEDHRKLYRGILPR
jgi:glycosyltransferase involved in cell wall biosynthesis